MYVGDVTEHVAQCAKQADAGAQLITAKNFQNLPHGIYYVSLGDLENLSQFGAVLQQAHEIVYCPPDRWSDEHFSHSQMRTWTEDYLDVFACDVRKTVRGWKVRAPDMPNVTRLADGRRGAERQIWIAGCSISHGIGVQRSETYGALISRNLERPVSFLTDPGASISWAADQILRSDLRNGDVVFWGITSPNRFTYWNDTTNNISHCTPTIWAKEKPFLQRYIQEEFLTSDHMIYQSIVAIEQVTNFCRKQGVELWLITVLRGMEPFLRHHPNFLLLAGTHGRNRGDMFLDVGSDHEHPGPLTHTYFAQQILARYHETSIGETQ